MRRTSHHSRYLGGFTLTLIAAIAATVFLTESTPLAYASGSVAAPAVTRVAVVAAQPAGLARFAAVKASFAKVTKPKTVPKVIAKKRAAVSPYKFGSNRYNHWFAQTYMKAKYRWNFSQYACVANIWVRESGWNQSAYNRSGAQGIPQAMPGSKMAKFGRDWRTNPVTQIKWGLDYIKNVYGSPCNAWNFWQNHQWY